MWDTRWLVCFVHQASGKGSLWCVDPEYRPNLIQALKKQHFPAAHAFSTPPASPPRYWTQWRTRCHGCVFFGKTRIWPVVFVCLLFGAVPLHPPVISFYKAARSKVRPEGSSLHFWSHRLLCNLSVGSILITLPRHIQHHRAFIPNSWFDLFALNHWSLIMYTIMFSAPGDVSASSRSPPCLLDL